MRLLHAALAISLSLLHTDAVKTPPVKLALRSSWPAPPLLVEFLESVSLENPDAFFPLLGILTSPETRPQSQALTSEAIHQYALKTVAKYGFLSNPGSIASLKMSLALHAATPKIEAFYEHYVDHKGRSMELQDADCDSWIDWYGETVCDLETLIRLAGIEAIESVNGTTPQPPKILPFDHIHPPPSRTLERPPRTAIFYASLTSPNFWDLHTHLFSLADKPEPLIEYVFRHIPSGSRNRSERNCLSGYGVALDLKKMDYLALDDRHSHHGVGSDEKFSNEETRESPPPDLDPIVSLLQAYPENTTAVDATSPLTSDELLEIGLQSTQLLADSLDPFHTLTYLTQNFPKYATSIARRVVVNESLAEEVQQNHMKAEGGVNMVWLNGAIVNARDFNPFGLLRLLRKERDLVLALTSLGLTREQAVELLTHPAVSTAQNGNGMDGLFDASDRPEGGDVIIWWNDFEKDNRYARWNPNLSALLRPLFPGQFHNVKSNLFNVVLVLDLSQISSLQFIAGAVAHIIDRNFPFRFGVVPIAETQEGTQVARLFYHLIKWYGRATTMSYIKQIAQITVPINLLTPTINWDVARSEYDALLVTETPREEDVVTDFDSIINGAEVSENYLEQSRAYAQRLGVDLASSPQGYAFVNGKPLTMDDNFLQLMQVEVGQQLQYLQEKLYEGELTDSNTASMTNYFYDLPGSIQRRNRHIYPASTPGSLRVVNVPELFSRSGFSVSNEGFVYPPGVERIPLSLFVVADLNSDSGSSLITEVLNSMDEESLARVSFIHNPTHPISDLSAGSKISWTISHLLSLGSLSKASPATILRALGLDVSVFANESPQVVLSQEKSLLELTGGVAIEDFNASAYAKYVKSSRLVVRELKLAPGEPALVVNGRVVGPFKLGEFVSADLKALETYELRRRAEPVIQALESIVSTDHDKGTYTQLVSMSASILAAIQLPDPSENGLFDTAPRPRQRNYQYLSSNHTMFQFGERSTALYHVAVLLDPVSETAQRWSSLLEWLTGLPDVFVELHVNPTYYSELPLKRFYRYNVLPSILFGEDGSEIPAQAVFQDLPVDPIYTLAMDVPPSWLVRPREALYDLDNIQLGSLSPEDNYRGVEALFDLDYLVVEGHARDTRTNAPPRGVQLQLTDSSSTAIDDTQVVANLGYLQFKAKPGVFRLEIREGRGRDIFRMESVGNDGWHSSTVEEAGNEISLTSFEGLTLYPRLVRLPGMETADVLAEFGTPDTRESKGFFDGIASSVTSIFKSKSDMDIEVRSNEQADINIFTVASGLLYERFVAIMILSVLRNTDSTVKFWFIENFLSPSFLEFIPHLADAYGFKYELVTYKWPSWLRAQKEKQRIIWAYKILFLDVLFPMDLKKVIFVDADQIVRADLKELVDLDLRGAPYGYTPMGDDNTDMEGFRFWKTGYWKSFLQGRPYHISALYVVDLVRFRQMAAGDILRGQYQQLSADPNSLANLDQDLPNNLQREVPIFSLHEDWLWCETWCSKERLHRAKTIDLCQNPLTKEPKLARARQIPEWEDYDAEISRFARKLAEAGLIRSRIATADANVLANAGMAPSPVEVLEEDSQVEVSEDEHKRDEL